MFKTMTLAVAALLFVGTVAKASDDLLDQMASVNLDEISDASADIEEFGLDGLDVDQLAGDAGAAVDDDSDAIEACFRRFGYRRHRGGYGYGFHRSCYRTYSHCYTNYCRPLYCYRPVYTYVQQCYPVYTSYWGCY
ncbi:hypothetical protein Mal64_32020 [Pseudobythopirellula maris]|uniref:Uncharacterized protein n=1 Tax=Pseudobythopirellula maris TaxID=2527991 RepID=A0A5C5ZKB1_9BACT|nr:hypothetical protein [Pseudobythopirellula maris]TWT87660.1 hypothetical protein Mal64_32020 [Pseudobythopirellula maris]